MPALRRLPLLRLEQLRWHGGGVSASAPKVGVVFVLPSGIDAPVEARVGETVLEVAHRTGIELEGACEASVACSTCHVVLEDDVFEALPEASEDEDDMLDQAVGLTMTSRLGCQVTVTAEMEGTRIVLPKFTRNFYVDGHVPQPH